jgi:alkanesulfonate monooxygenase SsuD/methylene tetrahydromethanopterin reductase-like flavin-dependent oxidoreductase (luciferase family)
MIFDIAVDNITMPQIGVLLRATTDLPKAEFAARSEDLEYETVWMGEHWGGSSFVDLTEVACRTERIDLGTAITNVFSRTPAAIAMSSVSLDRVSDGRFRLGVGPSTPQLVEELHALDFHRPIRRTHEVIELVRALTRGDDDRIAYNGELFTVTDVPPLDASFSIYNAALGPANRRVTGRLCDGWLPHNIPFSHLETAFEVVAAAAREAGRDPDAIDVSPYVPCVVSEDDGGAAARDALRNHLAYYVGTSDGYERAVAQVYPETATTVATAWRDGDRQSAATAVTDEMLSDLGVAGTPEEARSQLRTLTDHEIIDGPLVATPRQVDGETVERTVEALAPTRL